MLTVIQQELLQMLKEIDIVCRDNGIHYSVSGGTAIGAVRHKGFIPWDDDVDLYMTRDNWERLKIVYAEGKLPANRVLESAETDINYSNNFGRYVATDNTAIHSHQIAGDDPAGHVIDIFIFDPLHIDNFWKFMEDYQLYSDLMNETMGFSTRFDMNIKRYPRYYKRTQTEGKKTVIDELVNSFTNQAGPGWNHYVMEYGCAPLVFPSSIVNGGYSRLDFEDTSVEVFSNIVEYFVAQYGDEWAYIPQHEGREGHDAIFSSKLSYQTVRADYLPFIDKEQLHSAYISRKKRLLMANQHRRKAQVSALRENGNKCIEELMNQLQALDLDADDLRALLDEHSYEVLNSIFSAYYDKQLSADFIGRHDKHSTLHRFYNPVLIDIDSDLFEIAVENLIRTEHMSKAKRLIDVYEGYSDDVEVNSGVRDNSRIEKLKSEILEARALINEYSISRSDDLYKKLNAYLEEYPDNSQIERLKIRMLIDSPALEDNGLDVAGNLLDKLENELGENSIAYAELRKYRLDIRSYGKVLDENDIAEYLEIYEATQNGMIKLEIREKLSACGIEPASPEDQSEAVVVERKACNYASKHSFYGIARNIYRNIAGKDDRIKERAWEIALRTRDRVRLLELYEEQLDELEKLRTAGKWDELEQKMLPHEEAVMRNLEIGLGLCVHPDLNSIQKDLFIRRGEADKADKLESLIPYQHRCPIGQ